MRRFGRTAAAWAALALVMAACSGGGTETTTTLATSSTTPTDTTGATTSTTAAGAVDETTTSSSSSTTVPEAGAPLIAEGDRNETVEAFQFLINCNGFGDLTVDGAFGPATLAAVEAAQAGLGRTVNGAPDDDTLAELSRACNQSRPLEAGDDTLTVIGNADAGDPEIFTIALLSGNTLTVGATPGSLLTVTLRGADGPVEGEGSWPIDTAGNYVVEVASEEGPVTFSMSVGVSDTTLPTGEWILATNGITFGGTKLSIGDGAGTVLDDVFDFLGHGVRGNYNEFDTDWYTISDPQEVGLRGVFIEGLAFLFFGPSPADPDRAETLTRIRFEGPSDDAEGNPRPDNYVTTAEGITVGDTLADLKAAYGGGVSAGSNSAEHYYRFSDGGGVLCFYFGDEAPGDFDEITEIATECRG